MCAHGYICECALCVPVIKRACACVHFDLCMEEYAQKQAWLFLFCIGAVCVCVCVSWVRCVCVRAWLHV